MGNANLKILMIVLSVCIFVLSGCGSKGDRKLSKENQPTETIQISADGRYHYLMTQDEWNKLESWEEKYAVCQIPKKILEELDTPALLNLVLECPMLSNITYHESYYDGVVQLAKDLNGMYELQNRSDFYETVLSFFEKLKIPLQDKSGLSKVLPDNPKIKDYYSVLENDKLMGKVREDIQLENTINFCLTILGGMTENVEQDILERSGHMLSRKFKEIEASDYSDGVMTREEVKSASWIDRRVSGNMQASDQSKRKAPNKVKGH